eukprot:TRINITY_DN7106_c0_g1_i1.p2 TRINITY_DN7106_c0_g1~~TRINITY_DN7106_c0_g1_i1.p2  ORF type:complete len:372 (-),score=112.22 TRINITY_DN7106_c0_g1_i1:111-1226(-)
MRLRTIAALTLVWVAPFQVRGERPDVKKRLKQLTGVAAVKKAVNLLSDHESVSNDSGYVYVKAPGELVQGEINRSRATEQAQRGVLNVSNVSLLDAWAAKLTETRAKNSNIYLAYLEQAQLQEKALKEEIAAYTSDFTNNQVKGLQDTADKAENERNSMQSQLFRMVNGLARIDCPPPAADARDQDKPRADGLPLLAWDDGMPGVQLALEPLLNNRRFDTFEEAWRLCGETEGCGQVLYQEVQGTFTHESYGVTLTLPQVFPSMTGYFLRRRLDPEKDVGFTFDLVSAFQPVAQQAGVTISDSDPPKTIYRATNYVCMATCPSACMSFTGGVACRECAAPTMRNCTECNPDTKAGCSGNCPIMMMDCRSCL